MTFFHFYSSSPLVSSVCLSSSDQTEVEHSSGLEGDQLTPLKPPFSLCLHLPPPSFCLHLSPSLHCLVSFLSAFFVSFHSLLLSAHSSMSSLLLLFVSQSPTYLILSLLIFPAQPLCLSLPTFSHSFTPTPLLPFSLDLFGLFSVHRSPFVFLSS